MSDDHPIAEGTSTVEPSDEIAGEQPVDGSGGWSLRSVLVAVVPVVGLSLVFVRDLLDEIGRPVNPVLLTILGMSIAFAGTWLAVRRVRAETSNEFVRQYGHFVALGAIALVGATILLVPAPTPQQLLHRLSGDVNVAVLDFVAPSGESPLEDVGDLIVRGLAEAPVETIQIEVQNYGGAGDGAFLNEEEREEWAAEFGAEVNAHLIVAGEVRPMGPLLFSLTPMVYVRPDAIPDSPELAGWLRADEPIVTNLSNGFGPSERERLRAELTTLVEDVVLLAVASDEINNGRPAAAATRLDRLATRDTILISPELVAVYRGTAALFQAEGAADSERTEAIDRAIAVYSSVASTSPRARFGLHEARLAQAVDEGCRIGGVDASTLDEIGAGFGSLASDATLPPIVRARAELGELRVLACSITSGHVAPARAMELRDGADLLTERLTAGANEPDRAAKVVI